MGYDAVLLVQFCGLNPMGERPFKAGMPLGNLRRTLETLLLQGFSVAIGEEAPAERPYGQVTAAKHRIEGGVVTPSSPVYVFGLGNVDAGGTSDALFAAPTLGVALTARGFTLIEVHLDQRTYAVLEGLPEQALVARLWAASTAPLFEHESLRDLPGFGRVTTSGSSRGRHEGAALAAALANRSCARTQYDGEPVQALLQAVRQDLQLKDTDVFQPAHARLAADAPRPLFLSAALALGVMHSAGVPDLVASLLPSTTPRSVAEAMRALLLSPPPENVARDLGAANAALRTCTAPLPVPPLVPAGKIARLVHARECSAAFLADVAALCAGMETLWSCKELTAIGNALLAPAQLGTGSAMDAAQLLKGCEDAAGVLHSVLAPTRLAAARNLGSGTSSVVPRSELLGSAVRARDAQGAPATQQDWTGSWPDGDVPRAYAALPPEMQRANEGFRGRVRHDCTAGVRSAYEAVESAAAELDAMVRQDLEPFVASQKPRAASGRARGSRSTATPKTTSSASDIAVVYDAINNSVWLKAPKLSEANRWAANVEDELVTALKPAYDRNGRPEKTGRRHTTARVEKAAEQYRRSCDAAQEAVLAALRDAAARLDPHLGALVAAAQVALYLRLTSEHTGEALCRGWCMPVLLPEGAHWSMRELTPPWMERGGSGTVANDFDSDGMLLLTGPNMAGKSTVVRAAGTAALLANCGLHVPAAAAEVPRFGAFYVRMASADAPSEGLSHWGMDMTEAAALAAGGAPLRPLPW